MEKQARKLQATPEGCNPKLCPATHSLTGVECRATSVAKKDKLDNDYPGHTISDSNTALASEKIIEFIDKTENHLIC